MIWLLFVYLFAVTATVVVAAGTVVVAVFVVTAAVAAVGCLVVCFCSFVVW